MTEQLLHYIWKYRLFDHTNLKTCNGQTIEIIAPGTHNTDSGPDFFNARIKINETEWAGNVEIHINENDWIKHQHHKNEAYSNVILHVVYNKQAESSGKHLGPDNQIPVLELKKYIRKGVLKQYDALMLNQGKIPCAESIDQVDAFTISNWLDRLLIERLESKTEQIAGQLQLNNNSWEDAFYRQLARNFGFKINSVPFELLAVSLPVKILAKHKSNLQQVEALLFGQAGLLFSKTKDDYVNGLKQEYDFLQKKYSLTPIEAKLWKFMRMRPANFPTIRLAQFASLICKSSHLFSKTLEIKNHRQAYDLLATGVSPYWKNHFRFDKETHDSDKSLGKSSIENILINTVVPFLFHYGKVRSETKFKTRAIELLESIEAEKNNIVSKWKQLNIGCPNAAGSQALIQLYTNYCSQKKCLICSIGNKILSHDRKN